MMITMITTMMMMMMFISHLLHNQEVDTVELNKVSKSMLSYKLQVEIVKLKDNICL